MKSVFISSLVMILLVANAYADKELDEMETTKVHRNIVYAEQEGSNKRLTSLDVYSPASGSGRPVIVWIHGGAWKIGDKRGVQLKPGVFTKKGFIFISINYRFVPTVDWKTQAGDVATAIQYVHKNVKKVGGSPDRIYVMGHSAGAHLAELITTDGRYLKKEGLPLKTIKGVVLLDGAAYDIPKQIASARLLGKRLYESVFGTDESKQKNASPITHVAMGKGIPPFLLLHVAGREASRSQSESLAKELRKAGVFAKVVAAKGKTHETINRELGKAGDEPTRVVFEFLDGL